MIQTIRGFRDIIPPLSNAYTDFETLARDILGLYSYKELRLPTLEMKELFVKSTGETTDIVEKEMYAFSDSGGRNLALRPEGTPGAVRAYIENSMHQSGSHVKLFYIGNMFRAERPQAGRFREFEQLGAEYIGNPHPCADAESIAMMLKIMEKTGIKDYTAEINSIGCSSCRELFRNELLNYLNANKARLCENCLRRMERNPLRCLDCKADGPFLSENAPRQKLCDKCTAHFESVQKMLSDANLPFKVNRSLVRGLDYYTGTVFEIKSGLLGSQDALGAGGRYDTLIKSMGGPDVPAVGWAIGVDRTIQAALSNSAERGQTPPLAFVISLDESSHRTAFKTLADLRNAGIKADGGFFGQSMKSQMRSAGKASAKYAIIIGENEIKTSSCALKDLAGGTQKTVALSELAKELGLL